MRRHLACSPIVATLAIAMLMFSACDRATVPASIDDSMAGQFDAWDADGDGVLSISECPDAQRDRFDVIDTNNDGTLSRSEIAVDPLRQSLNENIPTHIRSVELIANIPYAETENPRQMLDLMIPTDRNDGPLPVMVFIHGGGWLEGDKWQAIESRLPYAESGQYATVSIGYRLTDEAIWPAQIHDCKAAIRWVRANAEHYGLDPDRIGVWGLSAGGQLVAMVGTSADDASMNGDLGPHTDMSTEVACVVDYFGPIDLVLLARTGEGSDGFLTQLFGDPVDETLENAESTNPTKYLTNEAPPFLIVHGTRDGIVPFEQSTTFHDALQEADVDTTLITVNGAGHGDGFGPDVYAEVRRFFDHHLRGQQSDWRDHTIPAGR
jgi:acetyl esterase/lipase